MVSCSGALVSLCDSLYFCYRHASAFDEDVLLFGDAFSMKQVWVVTGRELLKLPIPLMSGISSGTTQLTAWIL